VIPNWSAEFIPRESCVFHQHRKSPRSHDHFMKTIAKFTTTPQAKLESGTLYEAMSRAE
jgi:hypothetical protein